MSENVFFDTVKDIMSNTVNYINWTWTMKNSCTTHVCSVLHTDAPKWPALIRMKLSRVNEASKESPDVLVSEVAVLLYWYGVRI